MKKLGLVALGMALFFMSGYAQEPTEQEKKHDQKKESYEKKDWKQDKDQAKFENEEDFVKTVAKSNMHDVRLGQLAQQKGSTEEVRDLGKEMVQTHVDANQELEKIARNMNVDIPQELDKEEMKKIDELGMKSNDEFSQEYIDMIVQDYRNDISRLQEAKGKVSGELDEWISNTLPAMQRQLQVAENIQQQMNTGTETEIEVDME